MIRPISSVIAIAVVLAGLGAGVVSTGAESLVDARQRLMRNMLEAKKALRGVAEGQAALDKAEVKAEVRRIVEAAETLQNLFPEGTLGEPGTKALPTILADRPDFDARLQDVQRTALMVLFAADQGPKAVGYAFSEMSATCDGCHERYKKPER